MTASATPADRVGHRRLAALAAWAAAAALAVTLIFVRPPTSDCTEREATADARAAWEALWATLDTGGREAAAAAPAGSADPETVQPAGDTCGIRHAGAWGEDKRDANAVQRLALAAFVQDPDAARNLLAPLADAPDPRIRARAALEHTRLALRAGDLVDAERRLADVDVDTLPTPCRADVAELQGRIAAAQGDRDAALQALVEAVAADPWHRAAHEQLALELVHALPNARDDAACLKRARDLIAVTARLPDLVRTGPGFAGLARRLEQAAAGHSAALLAAATAWEWAGEPGRVTAALAASETALDTLPAGCRAAVAARIAAARRSTPKPATPEPDA